MNQPTENLLKQLEQATSRDSSDDQFGDEAATLRESWLMLGRLIEVADEESADLVPVPMIQSRPISSVRIVLAIAAALLIAFVSWSIARRQPSSNPTQEIAESAADSNDEMPSGDSEVAAVDGTNGNAVGESDAGGEFAWDDAFEEELTKASVAIHSARSDWTSSEANYSSLSDRFAEFEEELEEGSL
ncbi:MAG: hypothetical protein CMJ64_25805 [Planctomycetaceae bacterium]|nr:hypothetical protein [Planctomycetaceae bacterium]